jgi:beta-glucosidase
MSGQKIYIDKAKSLIKEMSLDEKIGMVHGAELFKTAGVPRLNIPSVSFSDGPCGVRQDFEPDKWCAKGTSQDYVSYLPCNSAIAATWNAELAEESGSVLGEEARGRGKDMILGPGVNIKRSPLCGRNFEYFSEDPYLTRKLVVPFIKGVQKWDVSACIKHFAVNNQETDRLAVDTKVDEEVLEEIYYPAFYDAVKAGVYSVMGAYNRLNGEHCCQSKTQLTKVLRDKWGFDGVVVSDWGGVHDTKEAAESGIEIEMNVTDSFDE